MKTVFQSGVLFQQRGRHKRACTPAFLTLFSVLLYSSTDTELDPSLQMDANSYSIFKGVDAAIVTRIMEELDNIDDEDQDGEFFHIDSYTNLTQLQPPVLWSVQ